MFLRNLLIISIFLLSFSVIEAKGQTLLQNDKIPKDLLIKLVRGVCHAGNCPVYELTINSDGTVLFTGMLHTKFIGKTSYKISQNSLKSLISEFEKADFLSLRDTYATDKDGCTEYQTHHSWEWISLKINGKTKEIAHDFGCFGEAEKFTNLIAELGKKIDEVTNSKRWIGERK